MFSPYDNANAREESDAMQKLSPEDKSTYEESIQRLRKYINQLSDSDGQHCSLSLQGALWQIEKLTNELAFMKSLYDQERAESKRLEESKLQILLILASLSASVCVALSPSYDLLSLVVGSVGAAFGSCFLPTGSQMLFIADTPTFTICSSPLTKRRWRSHWQLLLS